MNHAISRQYSWSSALTNHAAQLAIIKQMSMQESRSSAGNYQADEQVGITQLSWQLLSRLAGRNHAAQLKIIKQMSSQESHRSAGSDPVTEHALFTWLIIH